MRKNRIGHLVKTNPIKANSQKTEDGKQSWMNGKMVVSLEKLMRIIYKDRTFDKRKGFIDLGVKDDGFGIN